MGFHIAAFYKDDAGDELDKAFKALGGDRCSEIVMLAQAIIWTGVATQAVLFLTACLVQFNEAMLALGGCLYTCCGLVNMVWTFWAMDDFFNLSSDCEKIIENS